MKEQDSAAEGLERTRRIRLDVDVDSTPPLTEDSSKPAEAIEANRWYTTSGIPLEEKRREDRDPPITHRVKPKRDRFYTSIRLFGEKLSLNFPLEVKPIWQTFVAAIERDGSSASAYLEERVREWYRGHAPGNPQTPLEKWGSEGDLGLGEKPRILDYKATVLDEMSVEELLVTVQDFTLSLNEKRYIAWLIMEKRIRQGLQNKE